MSVEKDIQIKVSDLALVGQNIRFAEIDGNIVIVIEKAKKLGLSKSGKMTATANSEGFTTLPNGMRMNLYLGTRNG